MINGYDTLKQRGNYEAVKKEVKLSLYWSIQMNTKANLGVRLFTISARLINHHKKNKVKISLKVVILPF